MTGRSVLEAIFLSAFLLLPAESFLPNHWSSHYVLNPTDYTHEDITQIGVLKAVAKFFEDNPPAGTSFTTGQLQNLMPFTPTNLFQTYFGEVTSAEKLQNAINDIIDANSRVDSDYSTNAAYHMSGEAIQSGNIRLISQRDALLGILAGDQPSYEVAREMIGVYLHVLQDFYSNTNWVELNGAVPYEDLGLQSRPLQPVASATIDTCQNCVINGPDGSVVCQNNLIAGNLLTSGYKSGQAIPKPAAVTPNSGKCSHGGLMDDSRLQVPTGGINKETSVPDLSPHHHLHSQAGQAAIQATMNFFVAPGYGLLSQIGSDNFKQLLNLGSGNSMVFVIDVSGSMSNDLAAVRRETVEIVNSNTGVNAPYNYVLSTFSDPDIGPVRTTRNSAEMISWLNGLSVSGGGDCPEYCFSGIELALRQCLPESNVYVFTDADPKDPEKYDSVVSLVTEKRTAIHFLLTGTCSRRQGQEESVQQLKGGGQTRSFSDLFGQLAQISGGSVFEGDKDEIDELTEVINVAVSNSAPVVLTKATLSPGNGRVVSVQIDSSLQEFVISVVGSNSAPNVRVETPTGSTQGFGTADAEIAVNVGNNRVYRLRSPQPGTWKLRFIDAQQYMLEVTGSSTVDFTYQFVKRGSDGIVLPIEGRPVAGVNTSIITEVIGSENIRALDRLALVNEEGQELVSSTLNSLGGRLGTKYSTSLVLPAQEFRMMVEGIDLNNSTFQRVQSLFINPQSFEIFREGQKEQLFAGGTADVHFRIVNHGSRTTFTLTATDDVSMVQSVSSSTITLNENANSTGYIRFRAPSGTAVGTTSTATLSVTGSGGLSNSLVVRMTVEPRIVVTVDTVDPTCVVRTATGNCTLEQQHPSSCHNHEWSLDVQVRDDDSGVYSLTASPGGNGTSFRHDSFTPGATGTTITAKYTSNCCKPRGTITVSDKSGNAAQCAADYYIPTTPPPPTTPSPSTTPPPTTTPSPSTAPPPTTAPETTTTNFMETTTAITPTTVLATTPQSTSEPTTVEPSTPTRQQTTTDSLTTDAMFSTKESIAPAIQSTSDDTLMGTTTIALAACGTVAAAAVIALTTIVCLCKGRSTVKPYRVHY
ncbi:von Willebrand factor A domain-containing protein 7-like isoform X1 [Branchiostoma floridae x Branchiostoma belcheri]